MNGTENRRMKVPSERASFTHSVKSGLSTDVAISEARL